MTHIMVPIGYELHLTVLTGIIISPWFGAIAAFIARVRPELLGLRGPARPAAAEGQELAHAGP